MSLFVAFIFTAVIQCFQCIKHNTLLNVTHKRSSGIAIFENYNNVDTSSNIWHIDPKSQNAYDLLLIMQNEWTFQASIESQITLKINGNTPNISMNGSQFIIVFSVNNTQYFSILIHLDTQQNAWKYYPGTFLAKTNDVYTDIISGLGLRNGDRTNRVSNDGQWSDMSPLYTNKLQWPLLIKLKNNPNDNTFLYQCVLGNTILETEYQSAFVTDKDINIHMMNANDDGKPFDLYSIYVEYEIININMNKSNITYTTTITIASISTTPNVATSVDEQYQNTYTMAYRVAYVIGIAMGLVCGAIVVVSIVDCIVRYLCIV